MHIVIMGCGRVGSTLAHILEDRDNTVAVIDRDPEAFRRLQLTARERNLRLAEVAGRIVEQQSLLAPKSKRASAE